MLVESLSLRIYELTDRFDSSQMPQTSLHQSSPFGVFFRIKCVNAMPCTIDQISHVGKENSWAIFLPLNMLLLSTNEMLVH